jgi:response regulator RpfG family c-di-GMP phosphodiesterase
MIMQLRGSHFDPMLADAFLQCSEAFRSLSQSFGEE